MKEYLKKTPCLLYQVESELFHAVSFNAPAKEWRLDAVALWILLQLDNGVTTQELVDMLCEQFSELSQELAYSEIDSLVESELLSKQKQKPAKVQQTDGSDRRIGNLNIWIDGWEFEHAKESYLLWFLWSLAETVTVVTDVEQAEILFYHDDTLYSSDVDALQVLMVQSPTEQAAEQFDYIISSKGAWSPHHLKWLRFPDQAFKELSLVQKLNIPVATGYGIARQTAHFASFLLGEVEVSDPELLPEAPFLTIGMATHDDYDGVYFSLISLQIHHPEVFQNAEIIILDNNPAGSAAPLLKGLSEHNPNVRYIPYTDRNSTAVRDVIFNLARGEWVVCMDCHVLLPAGALDQFVSYAKANPQSMDMLQGPLLSDSGVPLGTHFKEGWRGGMYGFWGLDDRGKNVDSEPFEIPMQGLGLFACRKATWPGFNPLFKGFGGEEGYIHQKIRNQGGRCLCLPFLRWSHRFGRPNGVNYRMNWKDRISNYLIGFDEAGLPTEQVEAHFEELLSKELVTEVQRNVAFDLNSPFGQFSQIFCINLDSQQEKRQMMHERFASLKIEDRVIRFPAIATPEFHHIGCAMSHREIIQRAKDFGYETVLVFEDDARVLSGAEIFLSHALQELEDRQWKILYLGGAQHRFEFNFADGCKHLKKIPKYRLTCTHALVYHHSVYDEILAEIPKTEKGVGEWLIDHHGIDQYLTMIDQRFMVYPKPFTQPFLNKMEDEPYRYFYK